MIRGQELNFQIPAQALPTQLKELRIDFTCCTAPTKSGVSRLYPLGLYIVDFGSYRDYTDYTGAIFGKTLPSTTLGVQEEPLKQGLQLFEPMQDV